MTDKGVVMGRQAASEAFAQRLLIGSAKKSYDPVVDLD